ncbi:MAG: histidine kinase dimerization/phospho-acceptor domain-containing protein, partial [Planctomycetota bacterium]
MTNLGFQLPDDEASRDRLAELGQLAGALVHELKNPLGAIELNLEMLSNQVVSDQPIDRERMTTRLTRVQTACEHLRGIISSYLDFARPGRPDRERVDVNALLRQLLDDQSDVLAQADIQVVLRSDDNLAAVPADHRHLYAAFLNIILNAHDA